MLTTKKIHWYIIILYVFVTITGMLLDVMEPDAALYGSISKTMYQNNDFVNLYVSGNDWLDKPHLPFWLTAISFNIFGISNFSYKLPGVLIFLFGIWITYRFAKENYNKETAVIASFILATSQHSVLSNFDVRAEPYLTTFIISGLYWFYKYLKNKYFKDLIIACIFSALAVMTKGIFALIPIAAALLGELILKRRWKEILNPIWLVAFLLILIFITPELYALYLQFDLHPEKVVFGKTNVSGLKFFFWDSQFGRFFNTGPIKGSGDIFFFFHTILWAFLPWGILFYIASFFKIKRNIKQLKHKEEFYTFFGTFITLIVFSISKFQLPHYSNIVFPFMAILTADFIVKLSSIYKKQLKAYKIILYIQIALSIVFIVFIYFLAQLKNNIYFLAVIFISIIALISIYKLKQSKKMKSFYISCVIFLSINGFLFTHFYPMLFEYTGGTNAAKFINKENLENIYVIKNRDFHKFAFEFYLKNEPKRISYTSLKNKKNAFVFVNSGQLDELKKQNTPFSIIESFENYRITMLTPLFLNQKTRSLSTNKVHIIKIN